ncbi:MAG TPA: DUF4177 domain-containing protein [Gaiellaceae bacterium]|nr:DUF4177 domain-containing protein [Gaiellaceae bacterium]
MQRWEYKVVSLRDGRYTESLNDYGRDGWELLSVASDVRGPREREQGRTVPLPRTLGKLEQAAAGWNKLEGGGATEPEDADGLSTTLLWVFRRPLAD